MNEMSMEHNVSSKCVLLRLFLVVVVVFSISECIFALIAVVSVCLLSLCLCDAIRET